MIVVAVVVDPRFLLAAVRSVRRRKAGSNILEIENVGHASKNSRTKKVTWRTDCSLFADPRRPAPVVVWARRGDRYMSDSENEATLWDGDGGGEGGGLAGDDDVKLLWHESGLVFGGKVRGCLGVGSKVLGIACWVLGVGKVFGCGVLGVEYYE